LYVFDMSVAAWKPDVEGIREVFHASFTTHVYPAHTHDAWTLMLLDTGAVRYELDRHEHGALVSGVTLLPLDLQLRGLRGVVVHREQDLVVLVRGGVAADDEVGDPDVVLDLADGQIDDGDPKILALGLGEPAAVGDEVDGRRGFLAERQIRGELERRLQGRGAAGRLHGVEPAQEQRDVLGARDHDARGRAHADERRLRPRREPA
jgi:hypothetical protein